MRKRKLIDKVVEKKIQGKCCFCGNDDYAVLDVHRILPGEDAGTYVASNCIVACANCHRRVHDGQIKVDRKYFSTGGWVLHFWEGDEEKWLPL